MRSAFSLVELLIVVVLMGLIYTISVNKIELSQKQESKAVTPHTLKTYLQDLPHAKSVKLLCLDECLRCELYIDDEPQEIENNLASLFDSSVRVYNYSYENGLMEQERAVVFNSEGVAEDVCFSYEIDKNGVGDQVLVEYKNKVYDYTTYLGPTLVYNSTQQALEVKEKFIYEVAQ